MQREIYTIDATEQSPGRLATKIATLLQGKNKPDWSPEKDAGGFVHIQNVDKLKITGNKKNAKMYYNHSGYPGGLRSRLMKELTPEEIVEIAVNNMLPKNKLRSIRIKRLKFVK